MQQRRGCQSAEADLPPIAEAARPGPDTPSFLVSLYHRKLAGVFTRQRIVVSVLSTAGPVLYSLYGEWDFLFSLGTLPPDMRIAVYAISLVAPTIMIAAAFPEDVTSASGATFAFVPVVVGSTLRCVGVCLDLYHTHTRVNVACAYLHSATASAVFALWLVALVYGVRRRFSWTMARCVHGLEGALLVLCTLGLRYLGPPPNYAPGSLSFAAAVTRGGLAIFLSLVVLTPSNRQRMAELARRAGCWKFAVDLGELSDTPRRLHLVDGDQREYRRFSSPSTSTGDDDGLGRPGSHNTAKTAAQPYFLQGLFHF